MASGDTIAMAPAPAGFQPVGSDPLAQLVCDPGAGVALASRFPFDSSFVVAFNLLLGRQYGGGGLALTLCWYSPTSAGSVKWAASVARLAAGTVVSNPPLWGPEQTVVASVASAPRGLVYSAITFASGQLGGIQRGELFQVRIRRDNTVPGNAQDAANLIELLVKEQ
jgi:hypothetical protein